MEHSSLSFVSDSVPDGQNVIVQFYVGVLLSGKENREGPKRQPQPRGANSFALFGRACIYNIGAENWSGGYLHRSGSWNYFGYFYSFRADDQPHRAGVLKAVESIQIINLYPGHPYAASLAGASKDHAPPYALGCSRSIRSLALLAVNRSHR